MDLSYYPGCSLCGTSAEYDQSIRAVCGHLGVGLTELPDWTCCGASSAHMLDDRLARLLSSVNLVLADREGHDLVVPCAACYSRLKFAEKDFSRELGESRCDHPVRVIHLHDILAENHLLDTIRALTTRPLTGLKAVPYYGCLSARPPKIVDADRPEDPTTLDVVLETLGADVVRWSHKTECCGGSFAVSRPDVVHKLSGNLMAAAKHAGGDCFVTDCPMCQSNLDTRQKEIEKERGEVFNLPVFFITELVALALGVPGLDKWLRKHLVDPRPLLRERGLS